MHRQILIYDSSIKGFADGVIENHVLPLAMLLPRYLDACRLYEQRQITPDLTPFHVIRLKDGVPQQTVNSGDCGVYVCMFIEFLMCCHPLDFGPEHGSFFRTKMAIDLWKCAKK